MISLEPLKIKVLCKCKILIMNFHGRACSKDSLKISQLFGRSYCQIWFCFNNIGSPGCLCISKVYIFWGPCSDMNTSSKPFLITLPRSAFCQPNSCPFLTHDCTKAHLSPQLALSVLNEGTEAEFTLNLPQHSTASITTVFVINTSNTHEHLPFGRLWHPCFNSLTSFNPPNHPRRKVSEALTLYRWGYGSLEEFSHFLQISRCWNRNPRASGSRTGSLSSVPPRTKHDGSSWAWAKYIGPRAWQWWWIGLDRKK